MYVRKKERGNINVAMVAAEKEDLDRSARNLGLPVSEFVRRAIRIAKPILTKAHYPGVHCETGEKTAE